MRNPSFRLLFLIAGNKKKPCKVAALHQRSSVEGKGQKQVFGSEGKGQKQVFGSEGKGQKQVFGSTP